LTTLSRLGSLFWRSRRNQRNALTSGGPLLNRRDASASLGIVSIVLLLFSDAIFRGRVFYERDLHIDWYTQMESFVRSVAAGSWPLWDNSIAFGQPLLADPSAEILYPLTWLNFLMQPWWYYTVFVVFHACLAGLGLYRLGFRIGLSHLGALAAAAVWMTSGPFVSMVNLWHHFATAAWMPWVLLAADRALDAPRLPRSLTWGVVAACQIVAGSADICAMTALLSIGLVAVRIRWRAWSDPSNRRLLSQLLVAAVIMTLASAGVWAPVLDIARRSSRWNFPEEMRTAWSVERYTLPNLVLPVSDESLRLLKPRPAAPVPEPPAPLLASVYLGLPALGLVALAVASGNAAWRGPLIVSFVVGLLASMGRNTPFLGLALRLVPALRILRYPYKAMIVAALAWALLVGLGVDAWASAASGSGRNSRRARVAPLVLFPATIALLGLVDFSPLAGMADSDRMHVTWALASAAAMTILFLWGGTVGAPRAARASVVLILGDLMLAHRGQNRTAAPAAVSFRPPVIDAIASVDHSRVYVYDYQTPGSSARYLGRDDPYMIYAPPPGQSLEATQVLSLRLYPFPPVAGRWGIENSYDLDFRGLYPLPLAELAQRLRSVEGTPAHQRLLQLGAVRSVVSLHLAGLQDLDLASTIPSLFPEPIRVFHVGGALPRAYAVSGARIADGELALATLTDPDFDPETEIVLPGGLAQRPDPSFRGRMRLASLKPDRVEIEADLGAPGYVVLVDSFDPGWRASVDGADAEVLRANVAFRAVRVQAGRHSIRMVYRPRAVVWGLVASALSAFGLAAILRHSRTEPD
jgi:hypothetical protein